MPRLICTALWVSLLGLLQACSFSGVPAPVGDHSDKPALNPGKHTVRRGDTLYSIAWQYGVSVKELIAWNGLSEPYIIIKGEKIRVKAPPAPKQQQRTSSSSGKKVSASRPKPRTYSATPSQPKVRASSAKSVTSRPTTQTATRTASTSQKFASSDRLTWKWPANGKVIQRFNSKKVGNKGLNIAGRGGEPVHAAASGKIVYAGSGLTGLGRLIIIKHNNEYLSAYAHNRKLIAREGQWVEQGDIIARLGNSGTDRNELYFEIRKNGRPVDPMRYLPGR